eukprot:g13008.t1
MPGRVPRVHIAKRLLTLLLTALSLALAVLYVVVWHFGNGGVLGVGDDLVILYSCLVHFIAYAMSFALLKKEYERYLSQTWIGLRGLWFCAGVEQNQQQRSMTVGRWAAGVGGVGPRSGRALAASWFRVKYLGSGFGV